MIYQYDMDSCQAIGEDNTACATIVETRAEEHAALRLLTVAEADAAQTVRRPDVVAVLAYQRFFGSLD